MERFGGGGGGGGASTLLLLAEDEDDEAVANFVATDDNVAAKYDKAALEGCRRRTASSLDF